MAGPMASGAPEVADVFRRYGDAYRSLKEHNHHAKVVGKMAAHVLLPWIHRVFANFKRWRLAPITVSVRRICADISTSLCSAGTDDATCGHRRNRRYRAAACRCLCRGARQGF
jgi:hypothetical protein